MRPARDLDHPAAPEKRVVALVGVRLEMAAELPQEPLRPVPLVGGRRVEYDLPADRVEVGPQASLEAPSDVRQHRDRRVVGLRHLRG